MAEPKTAAELESMIMVELREHPECDSAGVVVIRPLGLSWDAALGRVLINGHQLSPCGRCLLFPNSGHATSLLKEADLILLL